MEFENYWERITEKNEALKDESGLMKITVKSFRMSMMRAFEQGNKSRKEYAAAAILDDTEVEIVDLPPQSIRRDCA